MTTMTHRLTTFLLLLVALLSLFTGTAAAQKATLTDLDKANAIREGTKRKGKLTGLVLLDSQHQLGNALLVGLGGVAAAQGTSRGFSVRVYTPYTWVAQLAADAAKRYLPFTVNDLTAEMLAPVLRVVIYPDTPVFVTGQGMGVSSSVEHVVLRDEPKQLVLQPLTKEPFADVISSARRDVTYEGLVATFPLDAVRSLRGPSGEESFHIIVIGQGAKEKTFKVKSKHFDEIP